METQKDTDTPARAGGLRLPVLPDGWRYEVKAVKVDTDAEAVHSVTVNPGLDNWVIAFQVHGQPLRRAWADSLAAGLGTLGKGIRAIERVAREEAAAAEARTAALAVLGEPETATVDDGS